MKKLFSLALTAICSLALLSCGEKKTEKAVEDNDATALSVDDVMCNASDLTGDTVTVEAPCSHLCSQGGKKAFLVGSADTLLLRCEAYPLMGQPFPKDCIHRVLKVRGIVREQRIDEAAVAQMERDFERRNQDRLTDEQNGFVEPGTTARQTQSGCDTERTAQGQKNLTTFAERMADYRARIARRQAENGIPYLAFYYLDALEYEIVD